MHTLEADVNNVQGFCVKTGGYIMGKFNELHTVSFSR